MLVLLLVLAVSYLLGSLSGSLVLGRARGVDIRTSGSGNAGGTNAFRTLGWRFALGVVAIDIGKGALAAWLGSASAAATMLHAQALALACGFVAVIGHTWPVFFGFRGGKGAGTLVGALLVAWPLAVPVLVVTWLLVLVATGYVGLATILAALSLLPLAWLLQAGTACMLFAAAAALFIVFTHRGNVARLRAGTEYRFNRARLLHRYAALRRGPRQ